MRASDLEAPDPPSVAHASENFLEPASRPDLVEARGFEPLTSGLQSPRSAKLSYAPKAFQEGWLRGRDLNPRPLGYEPNELPDCSTPRHPNIRALIVGLGRFELPTSRLSGVRSNQLSYRPVPLPRAVFRPQKRATLPKRASYLSADAPEGRVASVANL